MFDEKFINLVFNSWILKWKWITYILAIILTITVAFIFVIILDITILPKSDYFDYDKIEKSSSILLWFFWVIMLFFIISMAVNWKQEIENNKLKILLEIKEKIWKVTNDTWFVNVSLKNIKWIYKELYRADNYSLRVWLDENDNDDFGRFYIYSTSYDKLDKNIQNNFKKEEWWDNWNFPFKSKYMWIEQFDSILKIFNIKN